MYELLVQAKNNCPDLLLLDWGLGGSRVVKLLAALRKVCPDMAMIVLSGLPEVRRAALAAGANAFVNKTDPPEQLMAVIQSLEDCTRRPINIPTAYCEKPDHQTEK